ncbi:MAG: hypothetical protein JKY48_14110 [Flavobacteriales bacterium]|nr:hypothetical protein [Flavobacteriales bacterium]
MARIEATGRYMPKKLVSNKYFNEDSEMFESLSEFFNGYEERRHADSTESNLSMAITAAKDALSSSKHCAKDIDLVTGWMLPSTHLLGDDLNLVPNAIGATAASVLPINTTCSSFLSALNLANSFIATGQKKVVLIIIAVNWTNYILDKSKRNFAFAGDGSAAVIVDGEGSSLIDINERNNSTPAVFESMKMVNPVVSGQQEFFTITQPKNISTAKDLVMFPLTVAQELLKKNPDIVVDKVFIHQAGLKMIHLWLDKLNIARDKVRHTLPLYANMTAANIPVSLDYWIKKGDIKRGETILFFSPAAGGHYIAILWKY